MAKQNINIGTAPNSGTGDPLRSAFTKINENFTELYNRSVFSGSYNDLTNKPVLFSGSYNDLTNKPTVPTDINQLTDTGGLLTSGGTSYNQSLNTTDDVAFNSITLATSNVVELEQTYLEYVMQLEDLFAQGIGGTPYTGVGTPASKLSYEALIRAQALNPLIPASWIVTANALRNAYYGWAAASVTITPSESGVTLENGGGVGLRFEESTGLRFPDNTFQTTAYTGSELGDLKISGSTIGTIGSGSGWGDHDIYLSPNGESYAWIHIPNDANTQNAAPLIVGNGNNAGAGVHIRASGSGWEFKPNAVLQLPAGGDIVNSSGQSVLGGTQQTDAFRRVKNIDVNRRIEEAAGFKSVNLSQRIIGDSVSTVAYNDNAANGLWYVEIVWDNALAALVNGNTPYSIEISTDNNNWYAGYIGGSNPDISQQLVVSNGLNVLTVSQGNTVYYRVITGGEPVVWWDSADLPNGNTDFRGAIINYHAFTGEATHIGTIHIVDDDSDENITHTEVSSGSSDSENDDLWLIQNEGTISYRRIDGEGKTLNVQWTAKVFYSNETYD